MRHAGWRRTGLRVLVLLAMSSGHARGADRAAADGSRRSHCSLGIGLLSGDLTYRIGGGLVQGDGSRSRLHFPISELVFPLDVGLVRLTGSVRVQEAWRMEVELEQSLTSDAGVVEDSDWILPGVLTVYSESAAELDAVRINARLLRNVLGRDDLELSIGGGLRYERLSFDVRNTRQISILEGYSGTRSGLTLTYDVSYTIPYLEVAARYRPAAPWGLSGSLGYAPLVFAEDDDAHLARVPPRYSRGSYEGDAFLCALRGRRVYSSGWFLDGTLDLLLLRTDGDQATRSGTDTWTIDATLESTQTAASISVGRFF